DQIYRDYADRLTDRTLLAAVTNVSLTKTWTNWNLVNWVRWYQDLTTTRPLELQRVPEIDLVGVRQQVPGAPWLFYETSASFVNFIRDVDGPQGVRADFHPRFFAPIPIGGYLSAPPFAGGPPPAGIRPSPRSPGAAPPTTIRRGPGSTRAPTAS